MLKLQAAIIENILQSLPVGLAVINSEGELTVTNERFCEILGYPCDELINDGWGVSLFDTEKNVEFNQVLLDVIQEESMNLNRDVDYVDTSGEMKHLTITSSFIRAGSDLSGIVVLIQDVTDAHLSNLREKIALEDLNRIQRERVEGLHKLALSVAHQIRNPVMSIGGFSSLVGRKLPEDSPLKSYVEAISEEAGRLDSVVKAVVEYAGVPKASLRMLLVEAVLEKAIAELRAERPEEVDSIEWRQTLEIDRFMADPDLLYRVLREIYKNTIDFCRENNPVVQTQVRRERGENIICITDNGQGIEKTELPYLFDPFYTTKSVSVGMGMALVKRMVSEMKGSIMVESRSGSWTKVTVRIPA